MYGSCEELGFEIWNDGLKHCNYCGSLHPIELAELINEGKAIMKGSDWKYGYPHKFYVDTPSGTYKFYINHFSLITDDEFNKVIPIINRACGITFGKNEEGFYYKAPCYGYQK